MRWLTRPIQSSPQITSEDLAEALNGPTPPIVLDVREPFEWRSGHIPGAELISLSQLPFHWHRLPRDRQIVVVCRSGHRSMMACRRLVAEGLQAVNLAGGYLRWQGDLQRTHGGGLTK